MDDERARERARALLDVDESGVVGLLYEWAGVLERDAEHRYRLPEGTSPSEGALENVITALVDSESGPEDAAQLAKFVEQAAQTAGRGEDGYAAENGDREAVESHALSLEIDVDADSEDRR